MEPRSYRMVISTTQDYVATSANAERQLYDWLADKRYDTSALDEGRNEIGPNVTLDHDAASGRDGAYTRWRLRETRPGNEGTWQSSLVVRADHREDDRRTWLQVDIEHRPASAELQPKRANTPNLAKLLLNSLDAQDGMAAVDASLAFIEPDDVDEVIEELCDEDRRLPIVVATIPYGQDTAAWTEGVIEKAFAFLPGLAILYVLTPEAQSAFNRALEYHPVFLGGIRTYLPGIDLAWKPDAHRHPVMSRSTVEANPRRAASLLASLPQRLALRQPLPAALDTLPIQRTRPRPATQGSEVEKLRAENQTLISMLTEAEQTETAHADEISDLRSELKGTSDREYELIRENDDLDTELRRARREVRALQIRLEQAGQYELAHSPADEPANHPTSFEELLGRMAELPDLVFTGNAKITSELDDQSVGNWVETAWDALLALQDFAAASADGTAGGDFRSWCTKPPTGVYPFSAGKVKMKESDSVGNRGSWRKQRTFPVPTAVDPSGQLYMEAHLRIGGGNTVAPRLYFYDDGPNTGRVYVGYIGPHLTNTRT
ncbi:hypothetical protein ACIBG6_31000 [Streptomyces sp. NPDC050842]|uniref:hypothetical protein n=1 Tax=Streptomyces sp. NPDC050842 TaxID=3365636 RepID=UPI0037A761C6